MKYKTAVKKLQSIADDYQQTALVRKVAEMIIDQADGYEVIDDWFNDLFQHGCISGMVGDLIYYSDTHKFYDDNYDDIENLRYEFEQSTGEKLQPDNDLKNWFAWFAFEETSRTIAQELGIEI